MSNYKEAGDERRERGERWHVENVRITCCNPVGSCRFPLASWDRLSQPELVAPLVACLSCIYARAYTWRAAVDFTCPNSFWQTLPDKAAVRDAKRACEEQVSLPPPAPPLSSHRSRWFPALSIPSQFLLTTKLYICNYAFNDCVDSTLFIINHSS